MPGLKRPLPKQAGRGPSKADKGAVDTAKKPRTDGPRQTQVSSSSSTSTLTPQEVDFPRGGGTNLTPFEHKQVLREVKAETQQKRRDAVVSSATRRGANNDDDDDLFKDASATASSATIDRRKLIREKKNAQRKKRDSATAAAQSNGHSGKGKRKAAGADDELEGEQSARIEVLNYKRVTVGTRLLCTVLAVHPLAAVLSLPNQLLGHVPITSISEAFTRRLEGAAESDDEEDDEDSMSSSGSDEDMDDEEKSTRAKASVRHNSVPELRDLLHVGQWVVASVAALHPPESACNTRGREGGEYEQESQRIELTLEPSVVNEGVATSDLSLGYMLPLSVKSREDHGYLMDAGLKGMEGFIPFKEIDDHSASPLHVGQVVLAMAESVASNQRTFSASLKSTRLAKSVPDTAPSSSALLPGNLVNALVTNESPQGLNVKLFGMFDGTIDGVHMQHGASYSIGQRLKVRVLWEMPPQMDDDVGERKFALSAAKHVTGMLPTGVQLQQYFPIGAVVKVTVLSTIEDWGLTCEVRDTEGVKAFVHISNVSDDHIARLPASMGAFRVGTVHEARVIGHALTDDILRLSFQQSVLHRTFMRVSEVVPGEVVKCTIKAIKPQAIVVDMNGSVDGVVFPSHFADVPLKKPEKKYKVGQKVTARVWQVDPARNRIALSLKRTMVQSSLAIVGSIQDARVGVVTHGVVGRVLEGNVGPSAILVDLYGNLRAYVPVSEALEGGSGSSSTSAEAMRTTFFVGKAVKVRLTRVDYETGRITASIRQASDSYLQRLNVDAVQVGEMVEGKLAAVHQDVVVLELQPSNVRALLGLSTLARERKTSVEALRESLTEGETINGLKVLDKKADRGIVIVGGASSKPKGAIGGGAQAVNEPDIKAGVTLTAKASRKEGNAVTLHVGSMLRCRLHATDCADDYGDQPASDVLPADGSSVSVCLLNVRGSAANRRSDVSMRPSRIAPSVSKSTARDPEINRIDDLKVGNKYRGFVRALAEKNGLYVDIGRSVTARVMIAELFDTYVKDWISHFTIGQLVEGTITGIDAGSSKAEMSLRSNRGSVKAKGKDASQGDPAGGAQLSIRDISEGQRVRGFIKGVTDYGVFVQIDGTRLSGLAHKSQLSDDSSHADALKAFSVGDRVKAVVLKVDAESRKLSFGLKPSLFSSEDFESSEDEESDDESDGPDEDASGSGLERDDEEVTGSDDDDDGDVEMDTSALLNDSDANSDEEELLQVNGGSEDEDEDEEDGSSQDSDDAVADSDDDDNDEKASDAISSPSSDDNGEEGNAIAPALKLEGGLSWNGDGTRQAGESDSDGSDASSDEESETGTKGRRRRGKRATQEDLTADLATKMPETSEDFERLLLGSPNSSYLWIQFVSFQVQLGDISKARETAQRALQVIHFREEQEKFNVWIALLNLENTYGSEDSLEATFKEACAYNDAQAIHVRLAEILEQSGKMEAAHEQWRRTTKKYGFSPSVWIAFHRFLLRHKSASDEARSMVARSMQSLEKREHVHTIVAYALNEFKLGDAERARTIFEGLVDSYPKRLDIWWQYIDQETRLDNTVQVRDLFERILGLKQSSKKVKAVLKKWLQFEKRHGSEANQQAVLSRARRFVEERERLQDGDNDDEDGNATDASAEQQEPDNSDEEAPENAGDLSDFVDDEAEEDDGEDDDVNEDAENDDEEDDDDDE